MIKAWCWDFFWGGGEYFSKEDKSPRKPVCVLDTKGQGNQH